MVTLQILVLSFLVRIQVAQQSGRFFDRFFLLSVWVREGRSDLRGALGEWPTGQGVALPPTV